MGEIVARFADGRMLVQENSFVGGPYVSGTGIAFRIGSVKTIEKVLSLDCFISGFAKYEMAAKIGECQVSGDMLYVKLRRTDAVTWMMSGGAPSGFVTGGNFVSGQNQAYGYLSGITSGLAYMEELASSILMSGRLTIMATVIGY